MNILIKLIMLFLVLLTYSCGNAEKHNDIIEEEEQEARLPILGEKEFIEGIDKDTVYHTIPYWSFKSHQGKQIDQSHFYGKPYVAFYFFSNCPNICPIIMKNMKQFSDNTEDMDFNIIGHTVDPKRDSIGRLKEFANLYEIEDSNFHLITGNQLTIYDLGVNGYLVPNQEDALAPGGFLHSEQVILIDKLGRIRGYYNGLESESLSKLKIDLNILLENE